MRETLGLALIVLACALGPRALALAGDLKTPGLAFPSGFPDHVRDRLEKSLQSRGATFLGGRFVNWRTTLLYHGDTQALNGFLAGLANCPGVVLEIRFGTRGREEEVDWILNHSAEDAQRVSVHLNPRSAAIRLEDLIIPDIPGTADARR